MIRLNHVSKIYGDGSKKAVDDLSWDIEDGKITGFIGPNGAGKTTTLKMITGILAPSEGTIEINGKDIQKDPLEAKRQFGFVPDDPDAFLRVRGIEYLNFMADIYGVGTEERQRFIEETAKRFEMEENLSSRIMSYSHGMRQKIMVMGALIHKPPVWILDEPLTGLDPRSAHELKQMMREHADAGNAVLFSTHVLEVAEKLCDRIAIIHHGRQVSDGISKADELIELAMSGNAPVYKSGNAQTAAASTKKNSGGIGHQLYTQLMNGVSHMLPFVVGGGILIAIAFLIDGLLVDMNSLDAAARSNFGTITPAAAMFKQIGGVAFGFMLPVLAGYIAMAIGDRPALALGFVGGMMASSGTSGFLGALVAGFAAGYIILGLRKACEKLPEALEKIAPVLIYPVVGILAMGLLMLFIVEPIMGTVNTVLNNGLASMGGSSKLILGMILGGMMAIDMGGPFNKAAYVFGTAAIAAGNYDIMASVMIGGMVPPCAIALATLLFKDKFTKEERESGPTNFIMGLAFITEGAIPFAAADPIHVLPACIIGSGLAGALSMAFGCTLMAPHGGIFVVPVMGNALLYLVAVVIGTVVSAVLLGVLKKKVA